MAKQPIKQAYLYSGPVTSFDVEPGKSKILFPGKPYTDLPTDNPIIANLIARKLLVPETNTAADETAATSAESAGA